MGVALEDGRKEWTVLERPLKESEQNRKLPLWIGDHPSQRQGNEGLLTNPLGFLGWNREEKEADNYKLTDNFLRERRNLWWRFTS